jgi:hypothetical protein
MAVDDDESEHVHAIVPVPVQHANTIGSMSKEELARLCKKVSTPQAYAALEMCTSEELIKAVIVRDHYIGFLKTDLHKAAQPSA